MLTITAGMPPGARCYAARYTLDTLNQEFNALNKEIGNIRKRTTIRGNIGNRRPEGPSLAQCVKGAQDRLGTKRIPSCATALEGQSAHGTIWCKETHRTCFGFNSELIWQVVDAETAMALFLDNAPVPGG
eukprot:scaffold196120_cov24-Tisochrysis_lutea.AAC.1